MPRNLDLGALRSLIAIAETGGVTRAAQRLHLTQSAVSMQIKRLEENLDIALLSREGRGVSLTRRGEELLPLARKLIALNDEIVEQMSTPEHVGEVVFGAPHDIIHPHVPIVLRQFNEDFPGVHVRLISSLSQVLHEKFASGEADVIITTEASLKPGGETLERRPLIWVGAHGGRAWRRRPVPLSFEQRCAFRPLSQKALEDAGIEWTSATDTEFLDAAVATIAADLAICTLMQGQESINLAEIDHGGELPTLPSLNINLYAVSGTHNPLASRLADYVRAAFKGLPLEPRSVAAE
ncbi:MAG: LysR family transcriptional regulator [Neomegalonema sp.]|nr:LysR family transcriptional regulator [Neomegalonema sp.]